MRAVLINAELARRRHLGIDRLDECWQGEWQLVNPPKRWHQRLNYDLGHVLGPLASGPAGRALSLG